MSEYENKIGAFHFFFLNFAKLKIEKSVRKRCRLNKPNENNTDTFQQLTASTYYLADGPRT